MGSIASNLQQTKSRLEAACSAHGRDPAQVTLLAVSKTFGVDAVREAVAAGQRAFGENYVQEALAKMAALGADAAALEWHLIGPLQNNKTRAVAEAFDWVQSIDQLKTAERLSAQRPPHLAPLQLCLQVNISAEPSKRGLAPAAVAPLAARVAVLPRVVLRGLMAIPEPGAGAAAAHRALRALRDAVNADTGLALDTLSMGMSADLEASVAAGATMVRIGSAIFGQRR